MSELSPTQSNTREITGHQTKESLQLQREQILKFGIFIEIWKKTRGIFSQAGGHI